MPEEITYRDGYLLHVPKSIWGDINQAFGSLAISALLGIAAGVAADNNISVHKCDVNYRIDWLHDYLGIQRKWLPTYPEAVIAALRTIETPE